MSQPDQPQLYLISPPKLDLADFTPVLSEILDDREIACFRLSLASQDEDEVKRIADSLRDTCHARDVAIVLEHHYRLVTQLGLDGCHLPNGARAMRDVRAELGSDAIIGAGCGQSRHSGISAAEAGADYVSFGPLTTSGLGDGETADFSLFSWWSDVIEVPIVAEGGLNRDLIAEFAPVSDFFALGEEIWHHPAPLKALKDLWSALG
ncbi:MAG: thiamine phosphate synthase [Alphaproteobacteria bacterium]|nr:thiamine phosphate synthase [Alphaproteobacteria bacterium]